MLPHLCFKILDYISNCIQICKLLCRNLNIVLILKGHNQLKRSRESAPRSSLKDVSGVIIDASQFNCSASISFIFLTCLNFSFNRYRSNLFPLLSQVYSLQKQLSRGFSQKMAPEQKYFDFKTILLLKFYLTGHTEGNCHL